MRLGGLSKICRHASGSEHAVEVDWLSAELQRQGGTTQALLFLQEFDRAGLP